MDCPQCESDEIGDSGICPACGYTVLTDAPAPEAEPDGDENRSFAGMIEVDYAEGAQDSAPKSERPQWKEELSQRLQAIRRKREAMGSAKRPGSSEKDFPASSGHRSPADQPPGILPAKLIEGPPARKPIQKPRVPVPRQKILQPLSHETSAEKPSARHTDPQDIQNLIDSAVSRKSSDPDEFETPSEGFDPAEIHLQDYEGKLILLSRTLCGLVDLIIVLLCTGAFVIAADFFAGIIALDAVSYLCFSTLFLLMYFFYSLFFLAASNQTVGMMITDLRVVDHYDERPSFSQLLRRCSGYLVSLLGLGFGLFWGLFDRDSLCFHDRISDTHVIRI